MAKRPPPPMYGRVRPKVPPTPRKIVVRPPVSDLEKQKQMTMEPSGVESETEKPVAKKASKKPVAKKASKKPTAKKASKKPTAKKASKKPTAKKASKKPTAKKVMWSEDMTAKALYRIAKDAGLDVRSKDWKHEIIAALKKAGI